MKITEYQKLLACLSFVFGACELDAQKKDQIIFFSQEVKNGRMSGLELLSILQGSLPRDKLQIYQMQTIESLLKEA